MSHYLYYTRAEQLITFSQQCSFSLLFYFLIPVWRWDLDANVVQSRDIKITLANQW